MRSKLNFLQRYLTRFSAYPLHFILGYFYTLFFGSMKKKIRYDVFRLPHYAFGVYEAALRAKAAGYKKVTVIEFGVANGRGLLAMIQYAGKVMSATGIQVEVTGFDSGAGMPAHKGYKDHPELYVKGDFPMQDPEKLRKLLPSFAKLVIADLDNDDWTKYITADAPIGFVSVDVDYYSSTTGILKHIHKTDVSTLLPNVLFYLDDVMLDNHNPYQGELLALNEFNAASEKRKFDPYKSRLRQKQKFYNEAWLDQVYQFHSFDHPLRNNAYRNEDEAARVLGNKYLNL